MARIAVTITNNSGEAIQLPHRIGDYELADGASTTLHMDTQRFKPLEHTDFPKTVEELKELNEQEGVSVSASPITQDEDSKFLENQLEAAEFFGAIGGRLIRMGRKTFTSGGGATQTFSFTPDVNRNTYQVKLTFLGDYSASTATDAQNPRVTDKQLDQFDVTMNAAPASDVDFDFFIFLKPQ